MGLGKTIQLLAMAESLRAADRLPTGHPILVVAPRSVIENWRREIEKFTPKLTSLVHLGPKRNKTIKALQESANIVITLLPNAASRCPSVRGRRVDQHFSRRGSGGQKPWDQTAQGDRWAQGPVAVRRQLARRSKIACSSCGRKSTSRCPGCLAIEARSFESLTRRSIKATASGWRPFGGGCVRLCCVEPRAMSLFRYRPKPRAWLRLNSAVANVTSMKGCA